MVTITKSRLIFLSFFVALYTIVIIWIYLRLDLIYNVDSGVIFGDVTFHYYPAGLRILNGENPYDSPFITHPPLMLLIFAFLAMLWPDPISIGFPLMILILGIPYLSYRLGLKYLTRPYAMLFSWIMTLSPLIKYSFVTLIDDDPLIMIGLMLVCYYYSDRPVHAAIVAGIFGAMKFIPVAVGVIIVLFDRKRTRVDRLRLVLIEGVIFGVFLAIGFILWGPVTLTRLVHYESFNSIAGPAMNPYHVLYKLGIITNSPLIKPVALLIGALLLVVTLAVYWYRSRTQWTDLPLLIIITLFSVYIANPMTSYMYYLWIFPFLVLEVVRLLPRRKFFAFVPAAVGLHEFSVLVSEWANYTWAYGPSYLVWAYVGSLYVLPFIGFVILLSIWSSRTAPDSGHDTSLEIFDLALLSPLPPQKTGESAYSKSLIVELSDRGLRILAITGPEAHPLEVANVRTAPIWDGRQLSYPFLIARFLKYHRPRILHVQFGPDGAVYGGLWGEVMLILLIIARSMGIKTTVTLHSTWMPAQVLQKVRTYPRLRRFAMFAPVAFRLYMKLLDWGTTTIQLSTVRIGSRLRKMFLREYRIREEKVLEIPHPCKQIEHRPDREVARRELGLEGKDPLLIFGFIRRGKGIDIAIKAMTEIKEQHPSCVLLIAGSPLGEDGAEYLKEVKALTKDLDLDTHVRFDVRFIPDDQVPLYFTASSVILLPYDESVGASGPAHNYAGYGTPIIAADVGLHMSEALGGNLVLFKNRDPSDLARKAIGLLSDSSRRMKIGAALRAYSESESWSVAAKRTLDNYRITLDLS